VEVIREYGIPAFEYIKKELEESEITWNCERFYEYEDYWDGYMDDEDKWEYEESADFEDHEALTKEQYNELRDFCHEHRPRP